MDSRGKPRSRRRGEEGQHLRLWWDLHLSLSHNPQAEKSHNPQEPRESRRPALHPASTSGSLWIGPGSSGGRLTKPGISSESSRGSRRVCPSCRLKRAGNGGGHGDGLWTPASLRHVWIDTLSCWHLLISTQTCVIFCHLFQSAGWSVITGALQQKETKPK